MIPELTQEQQESGDYSGGICENEVCTNPSGGTCANCGKLICDGGFHFGNKSLDHQAICRDCARLHNCLSVEEQETYALDFVVICRSHGLECSNVKPKHFETEQAAMEYQCEADSLEAIAAGCMPYPFRSGG